MPRCRYDHVRAVHKQAWTLNRSGYEVLLAVIAADVERYLGMQIVQVRSTFSSMFRPLLNLPGWFLQCRRLAADVYVLRNPDTLPLAFLLLLFGRKVIYDTHEDFSKRPRIRDISPSFLKPVLAFSITVAEKILARTASAVFVTQTQQLSALGGRTYLQPNAPLIDGPIVDAARRTAAQCGTGQLTMIYVGEITEFRGLWEMLELIRQINTEFSCRLRFVGWFHSVELREKAEAHSGWQYVDFPGKVSHAEALAAIRDADVGLALLAPVADYPTSSITKLFEYMQFAVPFVASDFPAWRVPAAHGEPGLYVDSTAIDEAVAACRRLLGDAALRAEMGGAGKRYIENEFNWSRYAVEFEDAVAAAQSPGNCRAGA